MLRGVNAVKVVSSPLPAASSALIPCYIGMAPIWQTTGYATMVGQAYLCSSFEDFKSQLGYAEFANAKWPIDFSLCEAAAAHFKHATNPIGPIICVLDAGTLTADAATPVSLTFSGGKAIHTDKYAVLDSIVLSGRTKDTDYTVAFSDDGQDLVFTDLTGNLTEETLNYDAIDIDTGTLTMDVDTFDALDALDQDIQKHPCVIAAPGWEGKLCSDGAAVEAKLQAIANTQINGHWYVQAYIQQDSSDVADALADKAASATASAQLRVCWPYGSKDGLIYTEVTKMIRAKMIVDAANGDIPFESASNKVAEIDYPCTSGGTRLKMTESQADSLNAAGLTTFKWVNGSWRTWGNKMANYTDAGAASIIPEELNDASVQMMDYICNDFQQRNIEIIDGPMSPRLARAIVDDYQVRINAFNSQGGLLYGKIALDPAANTARTLSAGDLTYGIKITTTPPVNSLTANTQYVADGLDTLQGGVL